MKRSGENLVRFNSKICKRDKSVIAFISFVYTIVVFKVNRRTTDFARSLTPETGHGLAVTSFNGFFVFVCSILVMSEKSYPCLV